MFSVNKKADVLTEYVVRMYPPGTSGELPARKAASIVYGMPITRVTEQLVQSVRDFQRLVWHDTLDRYGILFTPHSGKAPKRDADSLDEARLFLPGGGTGKTTGYLIENRNGTPVANSFDRIHQAWNLKCGYHQASGFGNVLGHMEAASIQGSLAAGDAFTELGGKVAENVAPRQLARINAEQVRRGLPEATIRGMICGDL